MNGRKLRDASRRMVFELVVLALLVGVPIDFQGSGQAWDFLLLHPTFLLHAVVGTAVLVEAVVLVLRSVRDGLALPIAALGLAAVLLAVGAGSTYVSAGQQGPSLMLMTVGWIGALVMYVTGWIVGRRVLARSKDALGQPSGRLSSGRSPSGRSTSDQSPSGSP